MVSKRRTRQRGNHRLRMLLGVGCAALALGVMGGCPILFPPATPNDTTGTDMTGTDTTGEMGYANTTDKTNNNAKYVGSTACMLCHTDVAAEQVVHGHAYKLNRVQGEPPQYPAAGTRAGVPNPPDGFTWADISYVIGGYTKKGRFIDKDGFILITGLTGVDTQWNLDFPPNGTVAGFVPYEADRTTPKPYDFSCFQCHTTGPLPQDEDFPEFQENRMGFAGTWEEPGIQCESCHGPASGHFTIADGQVKIDRSAVFVDTTGADTCFECHNRPFNDDSGEILASGGYVKHHEQWPELRASGAHSAFTCTTCHDPHVSAVYDEENAIVQHCTDCHPNQTMALHDGKVFVRGNYTEKLHCESCHMTFATKSGSTATTAVVGDLGRMGDTHTHIFRIDTREVDYTSMFSEDGKTVVRDDLGRAAVTVDFVCLRCHNGVGNAFELGLGPAADIADGMHGN